MEKRITKEDQLELYSFYFAPGKSMWSPTEGAFKGDFAETEYAFMADNNVMILFNTKEGYGEGDAGEPKSVVETNYVYKYQPEEKELKEMRRNVLSVILQEADWIKRVSEF
jgi:hypothetical protein